MIRRAAPLALALLAPGLAFADRVPLQDGVCDLAAVGISDPEAMTYNPAAGLAIVDGNGQRVRFVDTTCAQTRAGFSTSAYSTDPVGLTWAEDLGEYAIVDRSGAELYFTNGNGARTGSCDLATVGLPSPSGVARDVARGYYVVTDNTRGTVVVVDETSRAGGSCTLVSSFGTQGGAQDVAIDPLGRPALLNSTLVQMVDSAGRVEDQFDLFRTVSDDDGLVWDPNADDRVFTVSGSKLYTLDLRGTATQVCSTRIPAQGLSAGPTAGQLLVADGTNHAALVIDAATCAMVRSVDLRPAGVNQPSDVALDPTTGELVVTDQQNNELFFVDAVSGALVSRCEMEGTGLSSPTGVEVLADLDLLAVTSDSKDTWALLDRSCALVHVRSTNALGDDAGSMTSPEDLGWLPTTGQLVATSNENLAIVDFEGATRRFFTLQEFGRGARGVAADPANPASFYAIDGSGNLIHVDLPALAEDPTASGRYASATATAYLWERGDGRVTGTAIVNGDTMPLFGQISITGGTLTIGTITTAGTGLVLPVTVSPDFGTLTAPAPVGVLTRQ